MRHQDTERPDDPLRRQPSVASVAASGRSWRHDGLLSTTIHPRLEHLSERERQVLSGMVAGRPNKSIAYDLEISPRTVEVHRANVMAKMQAKSLPGSDGAGSVIQARPDRLNV